MGIERERRRAMEKIRPIHKLRLQSKNSSILMWTWCGVDPYRKGVQTENARGTNPATCKACLRLEWEAEVNAAEIKARTASKKGS